MRRVRLDRALDQALRCALLTGFAACGGNAVEQNTSSLSPPFSFADETRLPDDGEAQPAAAPVFVDGSEVCPAGEVSRLGAMTLSNYDFVALRSASDTVSPEPEALPQDRRELDNAGVPCRGAANVSLCQAELDLSWPTASSDWSRSGQTGTTVYGLVTTRGNAVELHQSHAAIAGVLGTIDSPQEAVLWVEAKGYNPRCQPSGLVASLPTLQIQELGDGYRLNTSEMTNSCPVEYENVVLDVARDGRTSEVSRVKHQNGSEGSVCIGRRPPGLAASADISVHATSPDLGAPLGEVGAFFARAAALELAAVTAFRLIEAELRSFGAPSELVELAQRAAEDEVRHAATCAELARRFGAEPCLPEIAPLPARGLFAFALDNVVEGCVRETFGAAIGRYQAAMAADPAVRAALQIIAADETRHAELSWAIHEWVQTRSSANERAELALAARDAVSTLRGEQAVAPPLAVQRIAGMPNSAQARAMLDHLESALWTQSAAA